MKNNKLLYRICILFTAVFLIFGVFHAGIAAGKTMAAMAATSEPGSVGDPLVTQSYLEKRIKEVLGKNSSSNPPSEKDTSYKKMTVSSGKSLTGESGTEFILYSGSGNIIGNNGVINLTTGEKFSSGNTAVKYSIYLVPDNNCGIRMTSKSVVFIKGNYKIN